MHIQPLKGLAGMIPANIYGIGRNYADHARELNNPLPTHPVIFTKPVTSLTFDGIITIPSFVKEPHYETELVVAIGKQGKNIDVKHALGHVAGYGIGIDVTARDIQNRLKKEAHPWFLAKGMDTFAPVSTFVPAGSIFDPQKISFTLDINGKRRQNGITSDMLFPINRLIAILSRYITLLPGDLIFTGTPEGVGLLNDGDHLHANLESGLVTLDIDVSRES